jgi:hypothetical protein
MFHRKIRDKEKNGYFDKIVETILFVKFQF